MKTTERIVIYLALALLALASLPRLLETVSTPAHAAEPESDRVGLSIAFVHVGKAMGPLLEAEHYMEERQRLEEEIREIDEDLVRRMEAFREAHIDEDPAEESPEVRADREALVREYEAWTRERSRRMAQLGASQIESAYRDVVAAVEVVAERAKIDVVFRFIPPGNDFQAPAPQQAYIAVRARIALTYPEALDVTDLVLEELALEVE